MRKTIVQTTLLAIAVAALATSAQASPVADPSEERASDREIGNHNPACTEASLRGSFGFTSGGTLLALPAPLAGPFAEIGRQTFDGRGNTDATATLSANGNTVRVTVQGTYLVSPDCTGSMTLYVLPFGSTVNLDFVIDGDGREVRAIVTDAGAVESRVYKKQF
jgi:hypothetical protein